MKLKEFEQISGNIGCIALIILLYFINGNLSVIFLFIYLIMLLSLRINKTHNKIINLLQIISFPMILWYNFVYFICITVYKFIINLLYKAD
jgi:hypothetical protein